MVPLVQLLQQHALVISRVALVDLKGVPGRTVLILTSLDFQCPATQGKDGHSGRQHTHLPLQLMHPKQGGAVVALLPLTVLCQRSIAVSRLLKTIGTNGWVSASSSDMTLLAAAITWVIWKNPFHSQIFHRCQGNCLL